VVAPAAWVGLRRGERGGVNGSVDTRRNKEIKMWMLEVVVDDGYGGGVLGREGGEWL